MLQENNLFYFSNSRHPIYKKLEEFATLKRGWSFNEGAEILQEALSISYVLVSLFFDYGFFNIDAFPGLDGEVRITLYNDSDYLEFTIISHVSIEYFREKNETIINPIEIVTFDKVKEIIKKYWKESCSILESLIQGTMIKQESVFRVLHSDVAGEYPFLKKPVASNNLHQSAPILYCTI